MYGGLGKVGLDYAGKKGQENLLDANESGDNVADPNAYQVPAFSEHAKQLVRAQLASKASSGEGEGQWQDEDSDEEMLADNIDQMVDELKQIDAKVEDVEVDINDLDKASYAVPDNDEGYR